MEMKEYIVTCRSYKDLQSLYNDMETEGGTLYIPNRAVELLDRREVSRNTHYRLTAEEAELIKHDKRVIHCDLSPTEKPGVEAKLFATTFVNPELYQVGADFTKNSSTTVQDQNNRQWGHLHSAGNDVQRRKDTWTTSGVVNDNVEVYNDGRHVDVVIVDSTVAFDSDEWESEAVTPGQSRFVQYDWYANHPNVYPGNYGYPTTQHASNHGCHVTGTVAGKYYGWAKEANIYALTYSGSHGILRIMDLIREFHKNKPINPVTGRKNPTITNHSWGYAYKDYWSVNNVNSIYFRGQTYNSSNPGPSGWTNAGIYADFGIAYDPNGFPLREPSLDVDVEDAIAEGVVVVAAVGNSNHFMVREGHEDYNNWADISGMDNQAYMHRGSSPGAAKGVIAVGAISSNGDHRRADFTNYGERIDVFAPGEWILSIGGSGAFGNAQYGPITRPGYPAGVDYMYTTRGTSMASPQVCGILACAATNRERFTQDDAMGYIQNLSRDELMTFDTPITGQLYMSIVDATQSSSSNGYVWLTANARNVVGSTNSNGNYVNPRFEINYYDTIKLFSNQVETNYQANISAASTSSGYTISGTDRTGNFSGNNPTINIEQFDHITFEATSNFSSHPLYIRDSNGNNVTNNGTQTGINQNGDDYKFITSGLDVGTYIYQCSAHPGMQGDIVVHPRGTYADHPIWIRYTNGTNVPNVLNNGHNGGVTEWTPGTPANPSLEYVDYTYQCGNHSSMKGVIRVLNPWWNTNVGKEGGHDDPKCQQGSPNREVFCNNPRPTEGYISGWKQATLNGRRRTTREDNNANQNRQLYPRTNGFYRA